jgi:hypothetical protein
MADVMASQNTDPSSWGTLYTYHVTTVQHRKIAIHISLNGQQIAVHISSHSFKWIEDAIGNFSKVLIVKYKYT